MCQQSLNSSVSHPSSIIKLLKNSIKNIDSEEMVSYIFILILL